MIKHGDVIKLKKDEQELIGELYKKFKDAQFLIDLTAGKMREIHKEMWREIRRRYPVSNSDYLSLKQEEDGTLSLKVLGPEKEAQDG